MEILCSLLPPEGGVVLMALDALVRHSDGRQVACCVGLGQGGIIDGEPRTSALAARCMERLVRHQAQQHGHKALHLLEVQAVQRAAEVVRQALGGAQQGEAFFFLCADGAVYDAVFEQLNLQLRPGLTTAH